MGPWYVDGAAGFAFHWLDTGRSVAFPGFVDNLKGSLNASQFISHAIPASSPSVNHLMISSIVLCRVVGSGAMPRAGLLCNRMIISPAS